MRGNRTHGMQRANSKLTNHDIATAKERHDDGESYQTIADCYGVCKSTIIRAIRGDTYGEPDTPVVVVSVLPVRPSLRARLAARKEMERRDQSRPLAAD